MNHCPECGLESGYPPYVCADRASCQARQRTEKHRHGYVCCCVEHETPHPLLANGFCTLCQIHPSMQDTALLTSTEMHTIEAAAPAPKEPPVPLTRILTLLYVRRALEEAFPAEAERIVRELEKRLPEDGRPRTNRSILEAVDLWWPSRAGFVHLHDMRTGHIREALQQQRRLQASGIAGNSHTTWIPRFEAELRWRGASLDTARQEANTDQVHRVLPSETERTLCGLPLRPDVLIDRAGLIEAYNLVTCELCIGAIESFRVRLGPP